jgi:two-component system, NarL family, invasion response regulator UvrY
MVSKRILIADDHSAIRSGIKHILSRNFERLEFGEAPSSQDALNKLQDNKWDLLILDINMPDKNGLELLRQLRPSNVNVPVLVFSMYKEDQIAVRALKAGASGYLSKECDEVELVKAVRQIINGRKYISLPVAELLASHLNVNNALPHEKLSDREYQTMLLIASGKTVSEIAKSLGLSVPTISTYRSRILEKMRLKNNAEITHYVFHSNLA